MSAKAMPKDAGVSGTGIKTCRGIVPRTNSPASEIFGAYSSGEQSRIVESMNRLDALRAS